MSNETQYCYVSRYPVLYYVPQQKSLSAIVVNQRSEVSWISAVVPRSGLLNIALLSIRCQRAKVTFLQIASEKRVNDRKLLPVNTVYNSLISYSDEVDMVISRIATFGEST